ncbi:hypothetical protein CspeluHIS016_0505350 [Cutaneotrichosporon spelunceum]|uniref:Uncharacterized protein n=1 Tax=Cutaneotrichosporon spelunceum TaxID=1672016 RepID=A0AAD3TXD8_9TREE|nr:hypothetical protein CspeluHIS016_0505350 [Cutaneotrichosporon spelunceum]
MPASDGLAPPLRSQAEKDIVASFGGWTAFCLAYGCKPWQTESNQEAKAILHSLATEERRGHHTAASVEVGWREANVAVAA